MRAYPPRISSGEAVENQLSARASTRVSAKKPRRTEQAPAAISRRPKTDIGAEERSPPPALVVFSEGAPAFRCLFFLATGIS